jgi:glutathione S-transferase
MATELAFYGDSISGNCYKLQLACAELQLDYTWNEVDILAGDTRSTEFRAMNPNGKVPVMKLADGNCLSESNAILGYLADGTDLAGRSRLGRSRVLQWMFFEQYSHEPYIATSRFIVRYLDNPPERAADLAAKRKAGYRALDMMEQQLQASDFIANDAYSIADIALFAYTHVAHEGGFDLSSYSSINEWMKRICARPNFVPLRA